MGRSAGAQAATHTEEVPLTPRVELRHDMSAQLFVLTAETYVALMYQVDLNEALVPKECRWCDPPGLDRSVRDALVWEEPEAPAALSDIMAFGVSPALALGLTGWAAEYDGRSDELWVNNLVIVEAALTTIVLTQSLKPWAGRERPAVHYREHDWERFPDQERNASFFSGHSSIAFSLAVASGTVAEMRGYRLAPVVWAAGLPAAVLTGYARIASDAHYFSDVVIGAGVGAAVGFALPYFLHPPVGASRPAPERVAWHPRVGLVEGGATVGAAGAF